MSSDELIARREGAAGFLTLNRPKAIHALTDGMVAAMTSSKRSDAKATAISAA